MVKFDELGMVVNGKAVSAKAANAYQNGVIGNVVDGVFTVATDGTYIMIDVEKGDDAGLRDYKVEKDSLVKCYELDGQTFDVTPESFKYATSSTYGNLVEGTTVFTVGTDGKFAQSTTAAPTATGSVFYKLNKKIFFSGNGVKVTRKTV